MSLNHATDHTNEETSSEEPQQQQQEPVNESAIRPSIAVKLIRHAESRNNEVYRDARYIFRGGTPQFDEAGWMAYIDEHRQADPGLSATGHQQAVKLAEYLTAHLENQAQHPVNILVSPMRRTCETIQPTLAQLNNGNDSNNKCHVTVQGFYFESEGCHINEVPQEGMNPSQIKQVLYPENKEGGNVVDSASSIDFVGFPDINRGWWCHGTGPETREQSEQRAAKFYLWLCEYLDAQLLEESGDIIFDAGVSVPGEEHEREHDKTAPKLRRRRTQLLIGHGDFMSLLLKRVVAGYGYSVEHTGIPHRSAFVHWNTGITDLEYFGKGRWLLMSHNSTPHFSPAEYHDYLSGGSLKDGWSYLMPSDSVILNAEVSVAFSDEELEDHVLEQREALKALYLSSKESDKALLLHDQKNSSNSSLTMSVEQEETRKDKEAHVKHFIVKRGLQVVGVATYSEETGKLYDVAVRPSAGKEGTEALFNAAKQYSRKLGRSGSLLVMPRSPQDRKIFESVGFSEIDKDESEYMELKH